MNIYLAGQIFMVADVRGDHLRHAGAQSRVDRPLVAAAAGRDSAAVQLRLPRRVDELSVRHRRGAVGAGGVDRVARAPVAGCGFSSRSASSSRCSSATCRRLAFTASAFCRSNCCDCGNSATQPWPMRSLDFVAGGLPFLAAAPLLYVKARPCSWSRDLLGAARQDRRADVRRLELFRHRRVRADRCRPGGVSVGGAASRAAFPSAVFMQCWRSAPWFTSRCRASCSRPTWPTSACRSASPSCWSPAAISNCGGGWCGAASSRFWCSDRRADDRDRPELVGPVRHDQRIPLLGAPHPARLDGVRRLCRPLVRRRRRARSRPRSRRLHRDDRALRAGDHGLHGGRQAGPARDAKLPAASSIPRTARRPRCRSFWSPPRTTIRLRTCRRIGATGPKFDYLYVLFTEDEAPNPDPSRLRLVGRRRPLPALSHPQAAGRAA